MHRTYGSHKAFCERIQIRRQRGKRMTWMPSTTSMRPIGHKFATLVMPIDWL